MMRSRDALVRFVANLKHSQAARALVFPAMNIQFARRDRAYANSSDALKLRSFEGMHAGEECFVIGNGPSLRVEDLDALDGKCTFAANRIFNIFEKTAWRPTFYVATDREFIAQEADRVGNIATEAAFINMTPFSSKLSGTSNIVLINKRPRFFSTRKYTTDVISFSERPYEYVSEGYTVTYQALQLALFMGFSTIYLLGMDHTYSVWADSAGRVHTREGVNNHCYRDNVGEHLNPFYVEGVEFAYWLASYYAMEQDAHIYNATRGGSLEVFERVDFDDVVTGA